MAKGVLTIRNHQTEPHNQKSNDGILLNTAKTSPHVNYGSILEDLPSTLAKSNDCLQSLEALRLTTPQEEYQADLPLIDCKHVLEVQDSLHRYGTYLLPYYNIWMSTQPHDSFFTWLDHGEGRYIDASTHFPTRQHCVPRKELDKARVHYCTKEESYQYLVTIHDGKLYWANDHSPGEGRTLVNTGRVDRWIFVIDEHGSFFLNRKMKGRFHHSSFVAGRPVRAAGRIVVENGNIVSIGPNSGHYLTKSEQLVRAVDMLFGFSVENVSKLCERCSLDMER